MSFRCWEDDHNFALQRLQTIEQVMEHLLERGMTGASAVFFFSIDKHVPGCSQHRGMLIEYSSMVMIPTRSERLRVTPGVGTIITVLNMGTIVLSGEVG